MTTRKERLLPGGTPRWIRCYDDNGGESADRYTVVFTHLQGKGFRGWTQYRGMSAHPFHPQGIGTWGESERPIDRPSYAHLGKKIAYADLPTDCKKLILRDYCEIWGFVRCAACGVIVEDKESWGDGEVGDYDMPSYCSERCYKRAAAKERA